MNFKENFIKFIDKIKIWWQAGKIQKNTRITYDVVWNIILTFIIIGVVGLFFAGGAGAGYFASLVKDEPVRSPEDMEKDIYNYEETSKLYFYDNVYFGDVQSDIYREEVSLENVSKHLKNAIIATEDVNFRSHEGVVPKAILRAVYQEVTNASVKTGGSTLTQQLIKNQVLTNEVSFERKAKEILLAMRLERFFEKDEILEAYLNIVPFGRNASGRNIAGIETAAQGIFGIHAKKLNLAQSAYIAGLPQSPSNYTPFTNSGEVKSKEALQPGLNRMHSVLSRMLEAEYISKKEYEKAVNYNIAADFTDATPSPREKYPYLTFEVEKRAKQILSEELAKADGYTKQDLQDNEALREEYTILADRNLRKSGYKIHTTINKKIYDKFQKIAANYPYYGPDKPETVTDPETGEEKTIQEPVQTGAMLIQNKTGRIIGFVGGRDYEVEKLNHATSAQRPNGSTMKPILDYAPAMELGKVQPASVIADTSSKFNIPGQSQPWTPGNYTGTYHGLVTARTALAKSYNVPAAKTYREIVKQDPVSKYLEKMGFTSLIEADHYNMSMSIGAITNGVTVEENTNAFSTFSNKGKFADAYMIEKIETIDGETIYEHKSEPVEVFSPQTSYLTLDMMRDVIDYGTATYAKSNLKYSGVDWAGKTGTSQFYEDAWFVATNPNVTMGTWIGYDTPKSIKCGGCSLSYSQRNIELWTQLVNAATDTNKKLMAPDQSFERPSGIVERAYCATSGKLPSEICADLGLVRTDIFNAKYVPTEKDNSLIKDAYTIVNGKAVAAGPKTPEEFTNGNGVAFNPEFLKQKGIANTNISNLLPSVSADIKVPSSMTIDDDGSKPSAPSSVIKEGGALSWSKSSSNDVVGYRIYRASKPGASFELMGNTTETGYPISDAKAVYIVKAVDYFGLESSASSSVKAGSFDKKTEKKENTEKKKEKSKEKKEEDQPKENKHKENKPKKEEASDTDAEKDESNESEENTTEETTPTNTDENKDTPSTDEE